MRVGEESSEEGFVNVWQDGRTEGSGVRGHIRVLLSEDRVMFGNEEDRPA